ncbi:baseplate J/gp47 family protein [Desulfosediminicola sp.]|uniref:baseplate J/gp47 family protein n=1 Tax=Desulfosediminicola sp. TaxID=2886825 RepID=UPI003AF204A0
MADAYKQMVIDAGIPTTESEMQQKWDELNAAEGVNIANSSAWSPFWRLVSAIVTTPAKWLVNLLSTHVLPNAFLRDATGQWLDLQAWAVDVERKVATKTTGQVLITKESADYDCTIEPGIFIATGSIGGKIYRVVTVGEKLIPAGTISAYVPVEAELGGSEYNLGPGYFSILQEPVPGVATVVNEADWITTAGADAESDEALRLRCRNQFSAVGQYHHDAAYRADISLFAGIQTDYVWFEHDAPRGPGSANAYVMIDSGAPSQELVDSINDYITSQGNHGHGDDLLIMPMPLTPYPLVVTVYHDSYLTLEQQATLQAEVENIVRYAFRENQNYSGVTRTMPFTRFSFSKLSDDLHQRLPDLRSVAFSRGDITAVMELATLESLTVNLEVA